MGTIRDDASDASSGDVSGRLVWVGGREWYEIRHHDRMAPFFMSLVSSSDTWWFVSSSGGMTAGRGDADHAFLPYETEDKVTLGVDQTGPLTVLRVHDETGGAQLWEPLGTRCPRAHRIERRLRKSVEGDALCFEEANLDLGLTFSMTLRVGDEVGFVRTVELRDDAGRGRRIEVLDGYRNVLPHGATQALQTQLSVLLDAYKRNERDPATGIAIFSLSSTLTDRAEASEALRANVLWCVGLTPDATLLTPDERIDAFRRGEALRGDSDVRGRRGAFLARATVALDAGGSVRWHVVADVSRDAKSLGRIRVWQRDLTPVEREVRIEEDVARGTHALRHIVGRADGLCASGDRLTTTHHFANTVFNVMRGGVFVDGQRVDARDFGTFVAARNTRTCADHADWLAALPPALSITALLERAEATGDVDLVRLTLEYLPLTFARRHGDPSRPWNRFSIQLRSADGTPRTEYQGNWRDIFQNWEPLAYAYPAFAFSMVAKFLNATTVDGYNPYRVTRDGIEWEVPEPDSPWANLGYWGDHQIIYLQKLLEAVERLEPGRLHREWSRPGFTYADVPYRLVPYDAMVRDGSRTIEFDHAAHARTEARVARMGSDGRLVPAPPVRTGSAVLHVTMVEKLLVLLLAKLTNLVPGGGVWMNTQRPEWNDANNALAGKGVSVVTAAYLRRFLTFFQARLAEGADAVSFSVSSPVASLAREVSQLLATHRPAPGARIDDATRRTVMDALGRAATAYRRDVYGGGPQQSDMLAKDELAALLERALSHVDHVLAASRRGDGLHHGYLVLGFSEGRATLTPLDLMLEGQVALLSSGFLRPDEALAVFEALRRSALYWPAERTYLLYPNRALPGFLEKNAFGAERVEGSALVAALVAQGDDRLVVIDPHDGRAHFGGDLRNAHDLNALLDTLARDPRYAPFVETERARVLQLFEEVFDHRAFTGRSGTFFAYEGLGSVYWHMVSKLLLAVQECHLDAVDGGADPVVQRALADAYDDVRGGLGFQKSPAEFGAFPTDPYSHTPETGGARQPGMTGQVKEELLTRMGELGVRVLDGGLRFEPRLLHARERTGGPTELTYVDVEGRFASWPVPAGALAFTVAQTPVVYDLDAEGPARLRVHLSDGSSREVEGAILPRALSAHVFARDGVVRAIDVSTRAGRA